MTFPFQPIIIYVEENVCSTVGKELAATTKTWNITIQPLGMKQKHE